MIEARAIVLRIGANTAVVISDDNPTCSRCASAGGCGAAKLTRLLCIRPREYEVANPVGARPGDSVVIGMPEGVLMKLSVAVYLVPLLLLVMGAAVGSLAAPADVSRDGYAIVGFLIAIAGSAGWIGMVNRRWGVSIVARPKILRRQG